MTCSDRTSSLTLRGGAARWQAALDARDPKEVGESISPPTLTDVTDECPFDHEPEKPPEVKNNLIGKGSQLATNMNNGTSTNLYEPFRPDAADQMRHGKLPQKNDRHKLYRKGADKGRAVAITFPDGVTKHYPVSCSAHHLVPSQESLKGHSLLQYMCSKRDGAQDRNHGFAEGRVWSDVGYDTNGSENGVYLPGNYAVGGGIGGLNVWYPTGDDDTEHDEDYIDDEKPPAEEYKGYELTGVRGLIRSDNKCWEYVAKAMKAARGQFHDRHNDYSNEVKTALNNIHEKYRRNDVTLSKNGGCGKCRERQDKIKERGLPAPYSVVMRLKALSGSLRRILQTKDSWRTNIYTSEWCNAYMSAVRSGGDAKKHAENFE